MLVAGQLWVRVVTRGKIVGSQTEPCAYADWQEALDTICRRMDLPRPVLLPRHLRDWEAFGLAHFLPEHFMESVRFDRMELQYIDPDKKKQKSLYTQL